MQLGLLISNAFRLCRLGPSGQGMMLALLLNSTTVVLMTLVVDDDADYLTDNDDFYSCVSVYISEQGVKPPPTPVRVLLLSARDQHSWFRYLVYSRKWYCNLVLYHTGLHTCLTGRYILRERIRGLTKLSHLNFFV